MGKSISKRVRDNFYGFFLRKAPRHVLKEELVRRQMKAIVPVYGEFISGDAFENDKVPNSSSESVYRLAFPGHGFATQAAFRMA